MSLIPQITCRNCGAKFSPLLGRCPSCGTRYLKNPFRSTPTTGASVTGEGGERRATPGPALELTNLQWQMVFGGILIVAVIVAVIILITASLSPAEHRPAASTPTPPAASSEPSSGGEGSISDPGVVIDPEISSEPVYTNPPAPTVAVSSITITYQGETRTEFAMNPIWGDVQLGATIYPTDATGTVTWRSTDTNVCTVDDTGLVHQTGTGTCKIIAECGGVAQQCTVYAGG